MECDKDGLGLFRNFGNNLGNYLPNNSRQGHQGVYYIMNFQKR